MSDTWDPELYNRFARERRLPFDELVGLCSPVDGGTVFDLGCGPGPLTVELAQRLNAGHTTGIDSSDAMLAKAVLHASDTIAFEKGDLATFTANPPADMVFSNAALHWVDDHEAVLGRWRQQLNPGGQLAVQVPCNDDHPAYPLATTVANEHPEWFPAGAPALATASVLKPEEYATILHGLGATAQHVALRVFVHEMPAPVYVADWLQSTTLNPFKLAATSPEAFEQFMAEYRARLPQALAATQQGLAPSTSPYAFTFKRILLWARF